MKVLLLGDASNYHNCLSVGLARAGHDVTVASNGSTWMNTARDIDLSRRNGKLGGLVLWARLNTVLSSSLKGYDVVHIHNPFFLNLRPNRIKSVFNRLKRDNGAVFLTALGTDPQYVDMCFDSDCPIRYSEYHIGKNISAYAINNKKRVDQWRSDLLEDHSRFVYDNIDGAVSALYEYHLSCLRHLPQHMVHYAGIPVDTSSIAFKPLDPEKKVVNVMLACHKGREGEKGADVLLPLLKELEVESNGSMHLDFVQNVPYDEFTRIMNRADIIVDQLYSYTPATTALLAMACGKVVVSGAEPEYYKFIGEEVLHPIINPDPADLHPFVNKMRHIIKNPQVLANMSADSRKFVEKHNDVNVVAGRFIDFWERRLG